MHRRVTTPADRFRLAGGILSVVFGIAHAVLAPIGNGPVFAGMVRDGWWDTVMLSPIGPAAIERASVWWFTLGSFAVPTIVFGVVNIWAARRGLRPPPVGIVIGVWGLIAAPSLAASPAWAIPVVGVLITIADLLGWRDRRRRDDHGRATDRQRNAPSVGVAPSDPQVSRAA